VGKEKGKEGKEFLIYKKKQFRRGKIRIKRKTETKANFSLPLLSRTIRIFKEGKKQQNLFSFVYATKKRE
jgi:hypothetical protein